MLKIRMISLSLVMLAAPLAFGSELTCKSAKNPTETVHISQNWQYFQLDFTQKSSMDEISSKLSSILTGPVEQATGVRVLFPSNNVKFGDGPLQFAGQNGETQVQLIGAKGNVISELKAGDLFVASMPTRENPKIVSIGALFHIQKLNGYLTYIEIAVGDQYDPKSCVPTKTTFASPGDCDIKCGQLTGDAYVQCLIACMNE
jgi:hypothetical protein